MGGLLCLFLEIGKKCPNLGKNVLIVDIYRCIYRTSIGHLDKFLNLYGLNFKFKVQFLRVPTRKNRRVFPYRTFLFLVVDDCLSKCPNSKKIPLT